METQADVLEAQTISHRHASGEVFEARNVETAQEMCPVLGKMSLDEVGLLLELEAIGKEVVSEEPLQQPEKPTIKRTEKQIPTPAGEHLKIQSVPALAVALETNHVADTHTAVFENIVVPKPQRITEEYQAKVSLAAAAEVKEAVKPMEARQPEIPHSLAGTSTSDMEDTVTKPPSQERMIQNQVKTQSVEVAVREEAHEPVVGLFASEHDLGARPPERPADLAEGTITTSDERLHEEHEAIDADATVFDLPELPQEVPDETEMMLQDDTPEITGQVIAEVLHKEPEENIFASVPVELPAPLAQIETALTSLAEAIEEADEERTEIIQHVFQEILALPSAAEQSGAAMGEVTEQKLEELFVELFERIDVDYSPELVTSFVRLTRMHYFDELLERAQEADEEPRLPDDVGTREFLQQLQHALVVIKKATVRLCELGRSALKLYGQTRHALTAG